MIQTEKEDRLMPLCRGVLLFEGAETPLKDFYYHAVASSSSWRWEEPDNWVVQKEPRPIVATDLYGREHHFRLLYDVQGLPQDIRDILETGHLLHDHRSCIIVELKGRESARHPLDHWKFLCEVLWLGLEAGAQGLYFPESHMSVTPEVAFSVEPWMLTSQHISLFVRVGVAAVPDTSDYFYVRTFGLSQFGLPDLVTSVEKTRQDLESVMLGTKTWLESVPQTLVEHYSVVPMGEEIALADDPDICFRRQQAPQEIKGLASPFGLHYFEWVE